MPATIAIHRLRFATHSSRSLGASDETIRAVVLGVPTRPVGGRHRSGRHDAGAAKRARGVEPQPRAHAVGVEPVPAAREEARRVAVAELQNAHRALRGLRRRRYWSTRTWTAPTPRRRPPAVGRDPCCST
jgi:hypothetical protein